MRMGHDDDADDDGIRDDGNGNPCTRPFKAFNEVRIAQIVRISIEVKLRAVMHSTCVLPIRRLCCPKL